MKEYYKFLKTREEKKKLQVQKFRKRKKAELKDIIYELAADIDTLKIVIVFGSIITNKEHFPVDIDIYMEVISAEKYFPVQRKLEEALEMPIDLHTQAENESFIRKIKRKGEIIFERKNRNPESGD